eukprot:TRINITY_DN1807_c0_g1_i2.p1 TRINITY_DN1807_c0_g1~~TRINITY_DN1807_c0_g1_i2.p1  ORF type:complete len:313 (+),score=15.26 TRINITY_DN1807_c0_g1_i2:155-1093(+)
MQTPERRGPIKISELPPNAPLGFSLIQSFAFTTLIKKTIEAPFDRVKLLLQCQNEMIKNKKIETPYKGIFDCIKRIYKTEGIGSFWRGNAPNMLSSFTVRVLVFSIRDEAKSLLPPTTENHSAMYHLANSVISTAATFTAISLLVYPLEFARVRLANDLKIDGVRQFKNMTDVIKQTVSKEGIKGIYRGLSPSIFGAGSVKLFQFATYDIMRYYVNEPSDPIQQQLMYSASLVAITSLLGGFVAYPFDTVRNRMMMTSIDGQKYSSTLSAFVEIVKNEGPGALAKGLGVTILRSFFASLAIGGINIAVAVQK